MTFLAIAVTVVASMDGETETDPAPKPGTFDAYPREVKRAVSRAVRDERLPPVALAVLDEDHIPHPAFIGERGDQDIVRTRDGGESGPRLRWDLDRSGRVERDEREITERELYEAVSAVIDEGALPRVSPAERPPA